MKGTVTFEQTSESSNTVISYNISGNDPNALRGFHIHQFGDNTNGCTSAGPHCMFFTYQYICIRQFPWSTLRGLELTCLLTIVNPFSKAHGAPTDAERHVGDLGNITTDAEGNAVGTIEDPQIKLIGEHSILGVSPHLSPTFFPVPYSFGDC